MSSAHALGGFGFGLGFGLGFGFGFGRPERDLPRAHVLAAVRQLRVLLAGSLARELLRPALALFARLPSRRLLRLLCLVRVRVRVRVRIKVRVRIRVRAK